MELNLVISKMSPAFLTTEVITTSNSKHHIAWNVPRNPPLLLSLREGLVHEERRAYVAKDRTRPFEHFFGNQLRILAKVIMGEKILKVFLSPPFVGALCQLFFQEFVMLSCFISCNTESRKLLDKRTVRTVFQFPTGLADVSRSFDPLLLESDFSPRWFVFPSVRSCFFR